VTFGELLAEIRACRVCEEFLPHGPRPVLAASPAARLLIVGQAPGRKVHDSGVAWQDVSGDRLREWLAIDRETFYDDSRVALVPTGFCFPGSGRSGDLPLRPECAPLWKPRLRPELKQVRLTLVVGAYAQAEEFGARAKRTLTETVWTWREYGPDAIPLPHPSPRNRPWLRKNPWFEEELLPELRRRVAESLES
jgi:uracil-DNA glycosylase